MYSLLKSVTFFFLLIVLISCKTAGEKNDYSKSKINNQKQFTSIKSNHSGISFNNVNQENNQHNVFKYEYFYNGGGVAVADFNNDGLEDVFFTANMSSNKIYINQGDFKFKDITEMANVNHAGNDWCTGVTIVDINNDGWQDIFISRSGWFQGEFKKLLRNLLYINNQDLTFTEKGKEYGFTDLSNTTQACFFDLENDGDLDVYFINHPIKLKKSELTDSVVKTLSKNYSFSDKLFINENNFFKDVTKERGLKNSTHSLGISSGDLNEDGYTDLYVSNDYAEPDFLLINQKDGTFKDESKQQLKHMSKFSMGVDIADINNDGFQDIINLEMLGADNYSKKMNMQSMNPRVYWQIVREGKHYQNMQNSLQLNNGNGTFSEISWLAGVAETDWSWCPLFADFNNDGFKDLFITNGYKRDILNKDYKASSDDFFKGQKLNFNEFKRSIPSSKKSNFIFENNKDLTFSDQSNNWFDGALVNSNGAACADFDNDGDLDIVINNLNDIASLYRNNNSENNNFIRFNILINNTCDFGAKVEILDKKNYQKTELSNVKGYLSSSEKIIHFGLAKNETVDSVLITWSTGEKTILNNLNINSFNTIKHENSKFFKSNKKDKSTLIKNVSSEVKIDYRHQEKEYDDYKREILLPHKLSQEGPFLDVADVNKDGLEDFFVGNGKGFAGELYIQLTNGQFQKSIQKAFESDKKCEDIGVLFFDYDNDGDQDLYVVSGSNEVSIENSTMLDRLYNNDGRGSFVKTNNVIPSIYASGSCVKASDFDNDGDLDLFIGGFQIPGQYPKAGKSSLLVNQNGKFKDLTNEFSPELESIGMVKDAVFADVNNDKKIDLIVAGQWMPIEIFINNGKTLERKSKEYNTIEDIGWFNTLVVEDINQDGFIDIIAGNLGLNTKHKASKAEPFKIYADDFDGNGTNDIVLGYYSEGTCYPVRGKQCSSEQLPNINKKFPSYNQFAMSNIFQIYGKEVLEKSIHFNATNFSTSILYSIDGNKYKISSLENSVQFAPSNDILAIDINNDSLNEFIIVGNYYPVEIETGRYDSHIGNVLFNDNGELKNIKNTGFFIDNDSRCIKSIIINNKPHLISSSNRGKLSVLTINQSKLLD